jgi:hypothetical protein
VDLILRSLRRTRLEGWPRTAALGAILRDGASKSAVADFDTIRCRSQAGLTSMRLLRMMSERDSLPLVAVPEFA